MAKRLAIAFFVVLGVCIFLVAGFLLVLFLAPGFSAFGIKYIAKDTHVVSYEDQTINSFLDISAGEFQGHLTINSTEVPIEICFASTGSSAGAIRFMYKDNFNGITNSTFDDPSLEIKKGANGSVEITTHEFTKFVYESSTSTRLLKIFIPIDFVKNKNTDLIINSKTSDVKFFMENQMDFSSVAYFKNLTVKTSGKIEISSEIECETYTQTSDSSIEIGVGRKSNINATNYVLISNGGKIIVKRNIVGDLQAKTTRGDIKFISCENLIATTEDGEIGCANEKALAAVVGNAKITTKSGNVTLGKVYDNETATNIIDKTIISTSSGNVSIENMADGTITTVRGSVSVKSANNVKIVTNTGKVTLEEAIEAVDVETKRGNIILGGLTMNNIKAFSRLGKITVKTASGTADVQSISGNIEFANTNCTDIKINAGGKLKATNLSGKVEITAGKDIDVTFDQITDDTTITLKDTVTFAKITAISNTARDTRFYLKGKPVTRYERASNGSFSKVSTGSETTSEPVVTGPLLSVEGKNAAIDLYFNS